MSDNITRCPKCHTSFRVGEAHLNTAKGAVRCGSCLNVFNAREHLITPSQPISANITESDSSHASTKETTFEGRSHEENTYEETAFDEPSFEPQSSNYQSQVDSSDEEDFLISDDMEKSGEENDDYSDAFLSSGNGITSEEDYESSLFERAPIEDIEDEDSVDDDEAWALNLLEDDDEDADTEETSVSDTSRENQPPGNQQPQKTTSELKAAPQPAQESRHESLQGFSTNDYDDDEYIDEESDTENSFTEESSEFYNEEDHDSDDQPIYADFDEDANDDDEYLEPEENEEHSEYANSFQIIAEDPEEEKYHKPLFEVFEEKSENERNTELANQYLESIEPEPVEFAFKTHSNFWHSKLLWSALSVVAGIAIVVQVAWINFDSWSIQKPYRKYYAIACDLLDCQLPVLIDRSKIKTANLVVRSHPKAANALVVDAILQNTAIFEQTFPVLDLVFTDSKDKVVAARRLNPQDYLGGELAGKTHMPIRQPIHIAIEIEDPGEKAVGYKITIAD